MVRKERQSFTKHVDQRSIILAVVMALAIGIGSFYSLLRSRSTQTRVPVAQTPIINDIGALGRLEPQGEVIYLSAPTSTEGARVAQLLVKKGNRVRAGQAIAILDSHERRLTGLEQAQKQVQVAQARLERVRAGAKVGEISAQKATIARLEAELHGGIAVQQATIARLQAELRNSQTENQRYQQLYKDGALSASDSDSRRLRKEVVQQQLQQAKATLNRNVETMRKRLSEAEATLKSIMEVRPTDVRLAQAEVENAKATVKQAQADLNLTYIRAPKDGQILKINTLPGEAIGNQGIAELGQTNQMYVVAEVYETDVEKVRIGQSVTITSEAFSGSLRGTVSEIDLQVSRQNIFNVTPTADTDRRVVEVKIRLVEPADSQRVAALTDLQVQVVIHI